MTPTDTLEGFAMYMLAAILVVSLVFWALTKESRVPDRPSASNDQPKIHQARRHITGAITLVLVAVVSGGGLAIYAFSQLIS